MAQKKAHEVDAWLRRPDPETDIVLIYGPDRGLVAERAVALIKASGLDPDDPFSAVKLDAAELEASPGRLTDEANTVPMFAAKRLVWVRNASAQKQLAEEVKALGASGRLQALVVIEAGDLKKAAPLRSAAEGASGAMALPCYADEGKTIDTVIDEVLTRERLTIGMEARQLLRSNLGGDRMATRNEVEKLALYCLGRGEITVDDVRVLVGDVSGSGADDAVDAVLGGQAQAFDTAFARLLTAGINPFLALSGAMRQFQLLALMRAEMDKSGKPAGVVVASARPPVFFARKKLVEAALQRWSEPALLRALDRLQAAVLLTRQRPDLASATARQVLIALLVEGARKGR